MSELYGHDFRRVRIHTGESASHAAQDVGALAYAHGDSIAFRAGHYDPYSRIGQRLLAHELAHLAQSGGQGLNGEEVTSSGDEAEREANGAADQILCGARAHVSPFPELGLARQDEYEGGVCSVDPLGEPLEDPAPPGYDYPQLPVQDHILNRARGGDPVDPANLDTKTWEANARKGGFEGNYERDVQSYMDQGMSRQDAEYVLQGEDDYILNDVHARPVDPSALDTLPNQSVEESPVCEMGEDEGFGGAGGEGAELGEGAVEGAELAEGAGAVTEGAELAEGAEVAGAAAEGFEAAELLELLPLLLL